MKKNVYKFMEKVYLCSQKAAKLLALGNRCQHHCPRLTAALQPSIEQDDNDMCKFKDTNLGIKKLDFNVKRGAMAAYLTDGREIIVPVSMFPDIKQLSRKQREEWMIMDDQYFSFEALSRIYSVNDLLRL